MKKTPQGSNRESVYELHSVLKSPTPQLNYGGITHSPTSLFEPKRPLSYASSWTTSEETTDEDELTKTVTFPRARNKIDQGSPEADAIKAIREGDYELLDALLSRNISSLKRKIFDLQRDREKIELERINTLFPLEVYNYQRGMIQNYFNNKINPEQHNIKNFKTEFDNSYGTVKQWLLNKYKKILSEDLSFANDVEFFKYLKNDCYKDNLFQEFEKKLDEIEDTLIEKISENQKEDLQKLEQHIEAEAHKIEVDDEEPKKKNDSINSRFLSSKDRLTKAETAKKEARQRYKEAIEKDFSRTTIEEIDSLCLRAFNAEVSPKTCDEFGKSLLAMVVIWCEPKVRIKFIELLLSRGADPTVQDDSGMSAIDHATVTSTEIWGYYDRESIQMLERNAIINRRVK